MIDPAVSIQVIQVEGDLSSLKSYFGLMWWQSSDVAKLETNNDPEIQKHKQSDLSLNGQLTVSLISSNYVKHEY